MKSITINELNHLRSSGKPLMLIDVRTPAEFEAVHVAGARLLPLDNLDCAAVLAEREKSGAASPIHILCHSGARAKRAAEKFAAVGFKDCLVVEGGTQAWAAAGLPVERGERAVLPLDRQMQTIIGLMIIAGVALAQLVDPAWIWLSGFAGLGLLVAGVTGFCPLRMVVSRMPWNQGTADAKRSCCAA